MSTFYNYEPPTEGRVLLKTSLGDVEIELWSKEAPYACKNFVQLCLEGYYDDTIFHRVIKDFIVQGGDPTGTGAGGESIYDKPFRDEFHQRLRFTRRGLVACANSGTQNDNNSQFFITLAAAHELNNKHTIFGTIGGNTMYNVLKVADLELDLSNRPYYPPKIIKTIVLENPFNDIKPRSTKQSDENEKFDSLSYDRGTDIFSHVAAVKNSALLSFEDNEMEDEVEFRTKAISSIHDVIEDPKLSKVPVINPADILSSNNDENEDTLGSSTMEKDNKRWKKLEEEIDLIKNQKALKKQHIINSFKEEQKLLKQEMGATLQGISKRKIEVTQEKEEIKRDLLLSYQDDEVTETSKSGKIPFVVEPVDDFIARNDRLRRRQKILAAAPKGTMERQDQTLTLLKSFESKLQEAAKTSFKRQENDKLPLLEDGDHPGWLSHSLVFEKPELENKSKNFSRETVDSFDIYDPRNPLNQRRREVETFGKKRKE